MAAAATAPATRWLLGDVVTVILRDLLHLLDVLCLRRDPLLQPFVRAAVGAAALGCPVGSPLLSGLAPLLQHGALAMQFRRDAHLE
eukprot:6746-Lingulodinium_polyedra.AAC.1